MKYEIRQLVWYLKDNKVHSAEVLSRKLVEVDTKLEASTNEQKSLFRPFGNPSIDYATVHGVFKETQLFATRDELADSLRKD